MSSNEGCDLYRQIAQVLWQDGEIRTVDEQDLEVHEEETYGLLGPNEAGKTTTVRLLNFTIKSTTGTATVNGYDILKRENEARRVTDLLAEIIAGAAFTREEFLKLPKSADCQQLNLGLLPPHETFLNCA